MTIVDILLVVAAYLLGSIPSAVWIGRRYFGVDVREHGSRNAGTTNTLRVLGRRAALVVFVLDVGKGLVAVTLSELTGYGHGSDQMYNLRIALAVAAVVGHIFPVFAGFRGGKGVATMAGALLGVYAPAVLLSLLTFLVVFIFSHYVSLSSMTAGVLFPVYMTAVYHQTYPPLVVLSCVISVMLILTHRKNIKRLIAGTESKIYIFKPLRKRKK